MRLPAGDIVNQFYSLNNHVLYSLSAHFTSQWFGESAWSLRLPALVFAICTIPALYHLGRQITSRQEALLATVEAFCDLSGTICRAGAIPLHLTLHAAA